MTTLQILGIKPVPRWKFWKIDNWEVKVKVSNQTHSLSIYSKSQNLEVFKTFVLYKYLYGDQFWDIHQEERKKQEPTTAELEATLTKLEGTIIELSK